MLEIDNNHIVLGGAVRSAGVYTGVAAPTTATVGQLGDIIYDANNNKWTMIAKIGSLYYWAPECFPADNTEYASHIDGGVVVWKKKIISTTAAAGGIINTAHNITNPSFLSTTTGGYATLAGTHVTGPFYRTVTDFFLIWRNKTTVTTETPNSTASNSRPATHILYYTKTV